MLSKWVIIVSQGLKSLLKRVVGKDNKAKLSIVLYIIAFFVALKWQWLAESIYVMVALPWLVPDRRIEKLLD